MKTLTAKFLALYLGCECMVEGRKATLESVSAHPDIDTFTARFIDSEKDDDWSVWNDLSQCKPILRPLSDISDEEVEHITALIFSVTPHLVGFSTDEIKQFIVSSPMFSIGVGEDEQEEQPLSGYELSALTFYCLTEYLLSKHFDIFGLIEVGLAIDKTKHVKNIQDAH